MNTLRSRGGCGAVARKCLTAVVLGIGAFPGIVEGGCPTLYAYQGWLKSTNIKYNVLTANLNALERDRVRDAFQDWNYHNITQNCSNVYFSPDVGSPAFTWTASTGYFSGTPDVVAATVMNFPAGVVLNATTTYYFGAVSIFTGLTVWNRDGSPAYYSALRKVALHEIGHTMGLNHPSSQSARETVMNGFAGINEVGNNMPTRVQLSCDDAVVNTITQYTSNCIPRPTASTAVCAAIGYSFNPTTGSCVPPSCPNPSFYFYDPEEPGCVCSNGFAPSSCGSGQIWNSATCSCIPDPNAPSNYCGSGASCNPTNAELQNCNGSWNCSSCECQWGSPIVVDVQGDGFDLTNAANGVDFDLEGRGVRERWSWTSPNSDDAWLILDRNGNALVDNGKELFGNFTPQPPSPAPNGFLALAGYDRAANGGNIDGRIDSRDAVFGSLRLWQDRNHNGISENSELFSLQQLGLGVLDLDYQISRRRDQHGNLFRYRARVRDSQGSQFGRWAWDVFLLRQQ